MPKPRIRLDELDQTQSLAEDDYKEKLKKYQLRLLNHQLQLRESGHNLIVVLEGPDASGKGGAIKRLVERMDPRLLRVYSIVKPTPEEYRRHYFWRFWNRLPAYGETAIFDRSWYGRVLVERVEHFATDAEWKRAYDEINEFERQLVEDRTILVKLYLHISKDEQLLRFKRRASDPYKHWKISDEDWRNRKKWTEHIEAAEDMFDRTDTELAPWTIIPANFKWSARVRVVKTVLDAVEQVLK
jgi:polyphosphate kinase 2 (PPK2 family)